MRSAHRLHRHRLVEKHVVGQRRGVPYEVVRSVCTRCHEVASERPVRRLAA